MPATKPVELILAPVRNEAKWSAYRLETEKFPLKEKGRRHLLALVECLNVAIAAHLHATPTLWIDSQPLHHEGGTKIFSSHSRQWTAKMGFCFDPSGDPPRKLRLADLMDADFGTPPKIHDRTAIHVTAYAETMPAYRILAGRGITSLLYFEAAGPKDEQLPTMVERFMQYSQVALRPLMTDGEFQDMPFYLSLCSSDAVAAASASQLKTWFGDTSAYLCESFDSQELLLLSPHNLDPAMQSAGLRRSSESDGPVPWTFTVKENDGD